MCQILRPPVNGRGTALEQQIEGVSLEDFKAAFNKLYPQGWRVFKLQAYVRLGEVLYNAVWRPGSSQELAMYGVPYQEYRSKYDDLWPKGWRLFILQSYVHNGGEVLYNAVWRPNTSPELQMYGALYHDYRNLYDLLYPQGWRLYILQSYAMDGKVYYNAVWRPGTPGELQMYGATLSQFKDKYDQLWLQGKGGELRFFNLTS